MPASEQTRGAAKWACVTAHTRRRRHEQVSVCACVQALKGGAHPHATTDEDGCLEVSTDEGGIAAVGPIHLDEGGSLVRDAPHHRLHPPSPPHTANVQSPSLKG